MKSITYPLDSRLLTSSEPILSTADALSFDKKNSIMWNNTLRNTYITKGKGVPTTFGYDLQIKEDDYRYAEYNNKKIPLEFNYLLTKNITIPGLAAGKCISSVLYNNKLYSLWNSGKVYQYAICDIDGTNAEVTYLDVHSAVLSSVYDPDKQGLVPFLWTNKQTELTYSSYENHIKGVSLDGTTTIEYDTDDYVPLGKAHSATVLVKNGRTFYLVGFDDIDHNRSRTFIFSLVDNTLNVQIYRWFGCVSVKGVITGEPIPDPDIFYSSRNSNGTYSWDMTKGGSSYIAGQLIGGFTPPSLPRTYSWEKLVIEKWDAGESVRTNISANDTKLDTDDIDPAKYFVSNFADSRSIYYDYGQGWLKTYVRKANYSTKKISEMYLYTYGCKKTSTLPYRKESLMAKGTTAIWDFTSGKLSSRTYTIGGNNRGEDSILALQPFTVDVLDEDLMMEMYALRPLSWSFKRSLITPGADHSDTFNVIHGDTTILCVDDKVYEITKTTDIDKVVVRKLADYMFLTNILDKDNLFVEDSNGNIELQRTAIPYNMECILDIEDKKLDQVPTATITANNTFYWAAGYNMAFTSTLSTGKSSSYLMPALGFPIYVSASQLSQLITEVIDERGTMVQPLLKNLFDDYEEVDVFYTIQSNSTTVSYMASNIVKTTEVTTDRYDLYGKATYEIDKAGWTWNISLSTIYYPVPIGADVRGVNYITPTLQLPQDYAARLYVPSGMSPYAGYLFAQAVYLGSNIFTIYGSNYYYNKQAIYFTGQDNYNTSAQFVCYALGMRFLANSGSEAFFYSDFEKRLFIFTGSQTMQPSDSLSNVGSIVDAMFSSKEQILYMLTDDDRLLMRSSTDLAAIDNVKGHLEGTDLGAAIVSDGFMILSPRQGDDHLPFDIKTSFFGDDDKLIKAPKAEIQFYRVSDKTITITIEIETLSGIERKVQSEKLVIQPSQWKARNYRHALSLRNNVGNGYSIRVYSEDEIAVSYVSLKLDIASENQASKRK